MLNLSSVWYGAAFVGNPWTEVTWSKKYSVIIFCVKKLFPLEKVLVEFAFVFIHLKYPGKWMYMLIFWYLLRITDIYLLSHNSEIQKSIMQQLSLPILTRNCSVKSLLCLSLRDMNLWLMQRVGGMNLWLVQRVYVRLQPEYAYLGWFMSWTAARL